ncbi:GDSL-type esterase/lipase family protein [Pseudahrensia aquimaris]|uniref:GDSL-type esterase/lipase family protein n=1 Tax=Pseudahrensia aquimaris TaxID=744461 RepID=A0ABW3FCY1_9HYPH
MSIKTTIAAGVVAAASTLSTASAEELTKRVLVYGDSNAWGWVPIAEGFPTTRLPDAERFAGVMQAALGDGYEVVVDGLNNRTTDIDDPQDWGNVPMRSFNGAADLPAAIAREMPLDLVIIMLGTNDVKAGFERTPERVAEGAMALALIAKESQGVATAYAAPKVLVVTPPPFGAFGVEAFAQFYAGGDAKSAAFSATFADAGKAAEVRIFDARDAMGATSGIDGVHFSLEDHTQLGSALATEVSSILK